MSIHTGRTDILPYLGELLLLLVIVFAFTSAVLIIAGAPPLEAYGHLVRGSLGSLSRLSHVIKVWIPLTLCACGLVYTFRIDLWNIGVEGQVIMGAVFTTWLLRGAGQTAHPQLFIALSLMAGIVGGAAWALVAGLLKTRGGVHEIFAGLGLNFVAQGVILWLIFGPWKRPGIASMSGTEVFAPELWLPMQATMNIAPVGLGLALAAIAITVFLLLYTRVGLALKAVGGNRTAAYLFGVKPGRKMILAMLLAGGFAGLAGSLQVCSVYHRLIPNISSDYGYLALLVVMLANYRIAYAPLVAFFFACLNVGSIQLPLMLQLDSSLSGVIQGSLVLATLAVHALRTHLKTRRAGL